MNFTKWSKTPHENPFKGSMKVETSLQASKTRKFKTTTHQVRYKRYLLVHLKMVGYIVVRHPWHSPCMQSSFCWKGEIQWLGLAGKEMHSRRRRKTVGQSGTVVSWTTYSGLVVVQRVGSTSKTTKKLVPNWPYCYFNTTADLLPGQPSARLWGQK